MPNKQFASPLTNDCVNSLYKHYLHMYQHRYTETFFFIVTWQHIHFWRLCVTLFGNMLITRGLLTREQYLQKKQLRSGDQEAIARIQQITIYSKTDLVHRF